MHSQTSLDRWVLPLLSSTKYRIHCFVVVNFHIFTMLGGLPEPLWVVGTYKCWFSAVSTITQRPYNDRWTLKKSLWAYFIVFYANIIYWENYQCIIFDDKSVLSSVSFCSPPQKSGYAAFVELPNIDSKIHSIFPHTSNIGPCDFLKVLDIFKFILQLHQLSSKSLLSVSLATPTLQFISWLVLMEITPGMGHSWFELWKFQISRNSLSWAMVYNWWLDSLITSVTNLKGCVS